MPSRWKSNPYIRRGTDQSTKVVPTGSRPQHVTSSPSGFQIAEQEQQFRDPPVPNYDLLAPLSRYLSTEFLQTLAEKACNRDKLTRALLQNLLQSCTSVDRELYAPKDLLPMQHRSDLVDSLPGGQDKALEIRTTQSAGTLPFECTQESETICMEQPSETKEDKYPEEFHPGIRSRRLKLKREYRRRNENEEC
ncbi:unnamed protein product [Cyprideis torosa]|uniref:Uncharacterized protein n=1 Tax=Cyprideis torosa TaxID=163714 RepID=A0A7R8W4B4_9CRUS|nr:unnamed protein product [Cyprideis torosa]CAG0884013.1 unnamed protein product [Cyprideis torosa]